MFAKKRLVNKLSFRNPLKAVRKSKRQAPRSGALFFRPFLLGDAKEMDKLDLKGVKHLLCVA
ncbi:MAG TPA: hypothetical protein PLC67_08805 [Spirochaetota bacterium]|nr:hypothetical protein [Spirochaetota bacterium]